MTTDLLLNRTKMLAYKPARNRSINLIRYCPVIYLHVSLSTGVCLALHSTELYAIQSKDVITNSEHAIKLELKRLRKSQTKSKISLRLVEPVYEFSFRSL